MTQVQIDIRVPSPSGEDVYVEGHLQWEPSRRRTVDEYVVLPRPFTIYLNAGRIAPDGTQVAPGPVTVSVAPTDGSTWLWKVSERVKPWSTRYFLVPDSEDVISYTDLVEVDPESLEPTANPEPAWWVYQEAFTQEVAEQIDVLSQFVDGQVEVLGGQVQIVEGQVQGLDERVTSLEDAPEPVEDTGRVLGGTAAEGSVALGSNAVATEPGQAVLAADEFVVVPSDGASILVLYSPDGTAHVLSVDDEGNFGPVASGGLPDGVEAVTISSAPPEDPNDGTLWLNKGSGQFYRWDGMYLNDWVPLGEPSPVIGYHALALGRAVPGQAQSISIGETSVALPAGYNSIVIGSMAEAPGSNDIVIGLDAESSEDAGQQIAIGLYAVSQAANSVVVGASAQAGSTTLFSGQNAVAVGPNAKAVDSTNAVALGSSVEVADANNGIAIGYASDAKADNGIAVGSNASVESPTSLAVGNFAKVAMDAADSTAVGGSNPQANGLSSTAIGSNAQAQGVSSTALGAFAIAAHPRSLALGVGATTAKDEQAVIAGAELVVKHADIDAVDPSTSLVLTSPDGEQHALTVGNDGNFGPTAGGGGGGPATIQTTVLAGVDGEGTVALGPAFQMLAVEFSGAARFRLYRKADGRTADVSRPFSTTYDPNLGRTLIYDQAPEGPHLDLELFTSSGWAPGETNLYYRVDGGPVDVTLTWVQTGAL